MEFEFNRDNKTREEIIFGREMDWSKEGFGGTMRFHGVGLDSLTELFEKNFIDPEGTQNDSPTNQDFFDFVKLNPDFTVHGYIVHPDRDDYRVSIEGLQYEGDNAIEEIEDFVNLCRQADEMDICLEENRLYSWWD